MIAPVLRRPASPVIGRDEQCVRPLYPVTLQPGPQLREIGIGARVCFEHAIVSAVMRPVVGLAKREVEDARPGGRQLAIATLNVNASCRMSSHGIDVSACRVLRS